MRAPSVPRAEALSAWSASSRSPAPRLAPAPAPLLVCGEWRDSLIKFQKTSGASDKGQPGPPRPKPNSLGAACEGSRRALRTSRAPLSVLLPARMCAAEGGGAAPGAGGEGRRVYTRVDKIMARGVCGRGEAGKEEHLCVTSSSRGCRHLSGSSQPKSICGLRPQGRAFRISEATLPQSEVLERAMCGGSRERIRR